MTKDVFNFDPENHRYTLNGSVIPGISFILENTGFVDKTWFRPEHAARGHAVHACCQFLIEGNLDWSTVHPDILPRIRGFEQFLLDRKPKLIVAEQPMYSSSWRFAGTPDLVLEVPGEKQQWIVDIKSGKSGLASRLQTSAQDILVRQHCGEGVYLRFVLELPEAGSYKLISHRDFTDRTMFLNALAMVNKRLNEGELSYDNRNC